MIVIWLIYTCWVWMEYYIFEFLMYFIFSSANRCHYWSTSANKYLKLTVKRWKNGSSAFNAIISIDQKVWNFTFMIRNNNMHWKYSQRTFGSKMIIRHGFKERTIEHIGYNHRDIAKNLHFHMHDFMRFPYYQNVYFRLKFPAYHIYLYPCWEFYSEKIHEE